MKKKSYLTEKRSSALVPTVVAGAVVLMLGVMAQPVYAQSTISGTITEDTDEGGTTDTIESTDVVSIAVTSASDLTVTDGDGADGNAALTVTGGGSTDPALEVTGGITTDSLNTTGNSTVGGTLDVAGATTLTGAATTNGITNTGALSTAQLDCDQHRSD